MWNSILSHVSKGVTISGGLEDFSFDHLALVKIVWLEISGNLLQTFNIFLLHK